MSTERQPRWVGALLGLASMTVGLGLGELIAGLVDSWASPVVSVGDRVIDGSPAWLKDFAIDALGTNDKPALVIGTLILLGLVAVLLGMWACNGKLKLALAGVAGFAVVGWAAASFDRADSNPLDNVHPVMSGSDVLELQKMASNVRIDPSLVDYLLAIVAGTRAADQLELGVSPRGTLALYRSAQALALIEGRDYCIADDIKRLVVPCFAHRIIITSRAAGLKNKTREAEQILNEILQKVAVPV